MPIHKFNTSTAPAEEYFLTADKLISGNPLQTLWQHYTDPGKKFFSGIWKSEPGKWKIAYTEEEYCQILEGTSVLTDAQGAAVTVTAGESFVIPRGFVGTWEVLATTRKIYVIYESGEPL
jgi:uncharacterized cupin superfamily protein